MKLWSKKTKQHIFKKQRIYDETLYRTYLKKIDLKSNSTHDSGGPVVIIFSSFWPQISALSLQKTGRLHSGLSTENQCGSTPCALSSHETSTRLSPSCRDFWVFGFGTGRWNISPGESRNFFGVISWKSCDSMWYLNIFDYMYWWVQRKIWRLHLHKLIISQRNKHDFHWFSIWLWLNIELLQKMMLNHHLQSFLVSTPRYPKYN